MKILSITSGAIEDADLYPYQEQTVERFNKNDRVIVFYGRQMGLTHTLCSYTLDCLNEGKNVLFLTIKNAQRDEISQRINLNLFNNKFKNKKVIFRKGRRNFVKISGLSNFISNPDEINDYDVIIVDNTINISNKHFVSFMDEFNDEFKGKMILASSGSIKFDGYLKELYRSKKFHNILARRFIHPNFSKTWYATMISIMGEERYRREYECREL